MKRKIDFQGIKFKTFSSFTIVIFGFLLLIWFFQFVLFDTIYKNNLKENLGATINEVADIFCGQNTNDVESIMNDAHGTLTIFHIEENVLTIVFGRTIFVNKQNKEQYYNALEHLGDANKVYYLTNMDNSTSIQNFVVKKNIDGTPYYFLLSANTNANKMYSETIIEILTIISITTLVTTIIVSFVLSKKTI